MLNFNHLLDEFNTTFNIKKPGDTVKLITDEYEEMLAEKPHTAEHLKECIDIIYIASQQVRAMGEDIDLSRMPYFAGGDDLDFTIECLDGDYIGDDCNDVICAVINYCESLNYNWQAAFLEVHRSNLSKRVPREDAWPELLIARKRYPNAFIVELQEYCLLKCADTNKVIKPTCYIKAIMKEEWYNTTK